VAVGFIEANASGGNDTRRRVARWSGRGSIVSRSRPRAGGQQKTATTVTGPACCGRIWKTRRE